MNTFDTHEQVLANAVQLFDAKDISLALDKVSSLLNEQYKNQSLLVISVMQGGVVYAGHLITRLTFMLELDYLHVSRYGDNESGGELKWLSYPRASMKGRSVLILDDILDEGITLKAIMDYCYEQGASSVDSSVLLHKKHKRCVPGIKCSFAALEVSDRYVFGFGMDYKGLARNLHGIYAINND